MCKAVDQEKVLGLFARRAIKLKKGYFSEKNYANQKTCKDSIKLRNQEAYHSS